MMIYIQKEHRTLQLDYTGTAAGLLSQLVINAETVLIVCDGKLMTPDDDVSNAAKIELLSVISGG